MDGRDDTIEVGFTVFNVDKLVARLDTLVVPRVVVTGPIVLVVLAFTVEDVNTLIGVVAIVTGSTVVVTEQLVTAESKK